MCAEIVRKLGRISVVREGRIFMVDEKNNPRRSLVSGATGFVGKHLTCHLMDHSPGIVRILARSAERVREVFGDRKDFLEVVIGDVTDPDSLRDVCDGVDHVYHCVALTASSIAAPRVSDETFAVNTRGAVSLAREAKRSRVSRFVFVSSTAAVGLPDACITDEATVCSPVSPYQVSKREAEKELLRIHGESGLHVVIVRPCLVAGEGIQGGELLTLFRLCKRGVFPVFGGNMHVVKPLIYVTDLVQALILAATRGRAGEIYLVHSGNHHTLGQILDVAGELVGSQRPCRKIPLPAARAAASLITFLSKLAGRQSPLTQERIDLFIANRRVDISKAQRELGYSPRHQELRFMLAKTYEHYMRSGQLE